MLCSLTSTIHCSSSICYYSIITHHPVLLTHFYFLSLKIAIAIMCIFSWDRWSCGHFTKNRIEYCSYARDLPVRQRDLDLRCHIPGDNSELNSHIHALCEVCRAADENCSLSGNILHYITLDGPSQSPPSHSYTTKLDSERKELHLALSRVRSQICQLNVLRRNAARNSIAKLTHKLLGFEDCYRQLGARYYGCGWFANVSHEGYLQRHHDIITEAFHGRKSDRDFFQPWNDLESSIRVALVLLNEDNFELAIKVLSARHE